METNRGLSGNGGAIITEKSNPLAISSYPCLAFPFLSSLLPTLYPSPVTFIPLLSHLSPLPCLLCLPPSLPFLLTLPHPSHSSSPPPSSLLLFLLSPASHTSSHLKFCILWDQILTSLRCSAKEINFAHSN